MPKLTLHLAIAVATISATLPARAGQGRGGAGQSVVVPAESFGIMGAPTAGPSLTGTGLLFGRVVDGSTGKPIQGATVFVSSTAQSVPSNSPTPPAVFRPQTVVTGGDGLFVFRELPKGGFILRSSLPGYLVPPTQLVTLAEGEKLNDVEVRLWRSGVVSGQVLDEQSEGVEGITISLVRIETMAGRRNLSVLQSTTTDDRGAYRFAALSPGDYGVCALFSRRIAPIAAAVAQSSGNNEEMQRTISGSGGGFPSGSGYRLGNLVMIQSTGSRNVDPAPGEDGRFSVFADVWYPSAPTVQSAQAVRVDSGQERAQVNLLLRIVPSVRIFGTLLGPLNRVSGMGVHLYPAASDDSSMSGPIEAAQTITDPDGGFGFIGVPAGSYVLRVVYAPRVDGGIPPGLVEQILAEGGTVPPALLERARNLQPPAESTLWAMAPVTAGDSDVTGIVLQLREGLRVGGTIVFEGTKERPAAERLSSATVTFDPAIRSPDASPPPGGWVTPDGKFATTGVVPGRYLLRLNSTWPGWTMKSILADGRDVSEDPLDVTGGDVSGVVITMTDRPTEISGFVRDEAGAPDRKASVLIFPSDRARWSQTASGRRARLTAVSRQGAFTVSALPAGDYFAVAVGSQSVTNWQDLAMLESLARVATRVTVRDGERGTVSLVTRVIR